MNETTAVLEPVAADAVDDVSMIERELALLVRRTRVVQRLMAQQVRPAVESGAFALLSRLAEAGASRPSELAAFFGVGKPTIGRQLACLEEVGLVARHPDPDDGRAHLLDLTADGRGQLQVQRTQRQAVLRERLGALPAGRVVEIAHAVRQLNEVLV